MSSTGSTQLSAEEITRASKSNLALAFFALSRERQQDISVFYAFCRVVDDIADEGDATPAERQAALDQWRGWLSAPGASEPPLASAVRGLLAKYPIDPRLMEEIIDGCAMDVAQVPYETWDDLRLYCYRVASVVGLVSIEIFGYRDSRTRVYAEELGLALQVTNILRDVGEDWRDKKRSYLPKEEMLRFGVTEDDLAAGRETPGYIELMQHQAARAEHYYRSARAALPAVDRRSMVAAEIMRTVYHTLLGKIARNGFHTLTQRYRLTKGEKLRCIARALWGTYVAPKS